MAGPASVKLIIDKKREEEQELLAFEELYDLYEEQASERAEASLWGKVIGGTVGYFTGGLNMMYALSFAGSEMKKWLAQYDDKEDAMAMLNSEILKGGKFNAGDLQVMVDEQKDYVENRQDAYYTDTVAQAVLTGTSIAGTSGGFADLNFEKAGRGFIAPGWGEASIFGPEGLLKTLKQGAGQDLLKHSLTSSMFEKVPEERNPDVAFNQSLMQAMGLYFV